MSVLSHLKVSHAVAIVGIVPSAFSIVVMVFLVSFLNDTVVAAKSEKDMVKLAFALDQVAHSHAVERGLTAGFLASQGTKNKDKLLEQRQLADQSEKTVISFSSEDFTTLTDDYLAHVLRHVLEDFKNKNTIRQAVDSLSPTNNAFSYYSQLNRNALTAIKHTMFEIQDPESTRQVESWLSLLWMKERVGQYRGLLNNLFTQQRASFAQQADVKYFLNNEHNWQVEFMEVASSNNVEEFKRILAQAEWKQVDKIVTEFITLESVYGISGPDNWFELATKKISMLKGLSDDIGASVHLMSDELESNASLLRTVLIVIFLSLIVPIVLFSRVVIKSISSRVELVNQNLEVVSLKRDLTREIPNKSQDELGQIIGSLNSHLEHLNNSFTLLNRKATESKVDVNKLGVSSQQVLSEARDQFDRTDQIATAIEEMSGTCGAVAEDMQLAAKETEHMQEQSTRGNERMKSILQSMEDLASEVSGGYNAVQQVSSQTEAIAAILQTIESIAEQTNLLALNAAIEAARAGDQGRGFAVVADEVRTLAQRTQSSTEEVRSTIESLVRSSENALSSMDRCTAMADQSTSEVNDNVTVLQSLFESIDRINETIERVAVAAEEQSTASGEINRNVTNVNDKSQAVLDLVSQVNKDTQLVNRRFDEVLNEIGSYRLS